MITIAAVVPQPPVLVPELSAGRAAETSALRAACLAVTSQLAEATPNWVVIGADPEGRSSADRPAAGTFLGYGVDVPVSLTPEESGFRDDLPLPLLIAGWLRGQVDAHVTARAELVPPDMPTEQCRRLGARIAASAERPTALLVVGDGATNHTEQTSGRRDDRAAPFDAAVATSLADADPAGLLAVDTELAGELNAVGRAPWQVLAGAAESTGTRWSGRLHYSEAPYGIAYHVALWRR